MGMFSHGMGLLRCWPELRVLLGEELEVESTNARDTGLFRMVVEACWRCQHSNHALFLPQPKGSNGSTTAATMSEGYGLSLGFPPQRNVELPPTEVFRQGQGGCARGPDGKAMPSEE